MIQTLHAMSFDTNEEQWDAWFDLLKAESDTEYDYGGDREGGEKDIPLLPLEERIVPPPPPLVPSSGLRQRSTPPPPPPPRTKRSPLDRPMFRARRRLNGADGRKRASAGAFGENGMTVREQRLIQRMFRLTSPGLAVRRNLEVKLPAGYQTWTPRSLNRSGDYAFDRKQYGAAVKYYMAGAEQGDMNSASNLVFCTEYSYGIDPGSAMSRKAAAAIRNAFKKKLGSMKSFKLSAGIIDLVAEYISGD